MQPGDCNSLFNAIFWFIFDETSDLVVQSTKRSWWNARYPPTLPHPQHGGCSQLMSRRLCLPWTVWNLRTGQEMDVENVLARDMRLAGLSYQRGQGTPCTSSCNRVVHSPPGPKHNGHPIAANMSSATPDSVEYCIHAPSPNSTTAMPHQRVLW